MTLGIPVLGERITLPRPRRARPHLVAVAGNRHIG